MDTPYHGEGSSAHFGGFGECVQVKVGFGYLDNMHAVTMGRC
jgi:hypothetical protein